MSSSRSYRPSALKLSFTLDELERAEHEELANRDKKEREVTLKTLENVVIPKGVEHDEIPKVRLSKVSEVLQEASSKVVAKEHVTAKEPEKPTCLWDVLGKCVSSVTKR